MSSKLFFTLSLVAASLFFNGCAKKGCTDIKSDNYSSSAKTNDGSCVYSEKLIVWQDASAVDGWNTIGVTALRVYVDGVYLGSFAATEYLSSAPDCNSNGQLNKTIDMGSALSKTVNITVLDENDIEWISNDVTINAGQCSVVSL